MTEVDEGVEVGDGDEVASEGMREQNLSRGFSFEGSASPRVPGGEVTYTIKEYAP